MTAARRPAGLGHALAPRARGAPRRPRGGRRGSAPAAGATWRSRGVVRCALVGADDAWVLWATLLSSAAVGFHSERTRVGASLSGPLVATLCTLVLTNVGVIPSASPTYQAVNAFLVPLAVPLLLLGADMRRVLRETGRLGVAFALGAAATCVATVAAYLVVPLRVYLIHGAPGDGWKIAAALCARHIGGAVNYVAVSEALGTSSAAVATGLAADNLVCALYFSSLFAIPVPRDEEEAAREPAEGDLGGALEEGGSGKVTGGGGELAGGASAAGGPVASLEGLSFCLALSGVLCAVGHRVGGPEWSLPCITLLSVAAATLFPKALSPVSKLAQVAGQLLMGVFFAAVGASGGSVASVVRDAPALLAFCVLQIFGHLALVLGVGRLLLRLPMRELLIASNANVGGAGTAAGMAGAKRWDDLIVPGVLVGVLGYAVATFLAIALGQVVLRPL